MIIVKNRLENKIKGTFLIDCLITYIERKFAKKNITHDEFYDIKNLYKYGKKRICIQFK